VNPTKQGRQAGIEEEITLLCSRSHCSREMSQASCSATKTGELHLDTYTEKEKCLDNEVVQHIMSGQLDDLDKVLSWKTFPAFLCRECRPAIPSPEFL